MKKTFVAGVAACLCAWSAAAADGTWTGAADGLWSVPANWQGGTVASGAGSVAYLADLAGPIAVSNDVAGLRLKGLVARGGAYSLSGLALTLDGAALANYGLVVSNGAHALGCAVNLQSNTQVYVASGASLTTTGLLDYLGGTTLTKKGAGEWVFAGSCNETNDLIRLDVVGGTLRLVSGAVLTRRGGDREGLRVGYGDTAGRLMVESGAALNVAGFVLGHGESVNATGYLLVDGGTLNADTTSANNPILVGRRAAGTLCASNNAVVDIANWFNLGVFNRGELHIGGNSTMTAGRFSLGWHIQEVADFYGPGVLKLASGRLAVANQFVWRSSGVASRTNYVTVGNGQAGSATLRLPATMKTASNNGSARLTLDGGTLEMFGLRNTSYGESLTNYLFGLEQFWVGRAGAVLDTTNNDVTVTQVIARDPAVRTDGGVAKRGTGRLTLAGGGTYVGPTVVEKGALRLKGALPTGALVVAPGATLSLADGQYRAFAPSSLTAGQGGESVIELEAGAANACDSLTLPAGAYAGTVRFALVSQTGAPNVPVGDYVVATYAGADPDVAGWTVAVPQGVSAAFEVQSAQKRVMLHVAAVATGSSVWIAPGSGAWADAANWNTAPANDPATLVLFGDALGSAASVSLASPATLGGLTFNSTYACTLSGAGLTFGAAGTPGALTVQQGAHLLRSAVSLPADLTVTAQPGASVQFDGAVTGSGGVRVTGGGAVAVTNNVLSGVALTLDNGVLSVPETAAINTAFALGAGGGTVTPAAGKTATLSGAVSGAGALTKTGASIAVMTGPNSGTGARTVRNGTLTLTSLADGGDLVIGEGTLKYTGPDVATAKGLTLRTSSPKQGAAFESDANVTFNGNIKSESGVFIKAGKGTLTFAAPGVNTIGTGDGTDNYQVLINRGAYGDSPTQGLRLLQVLNGKVVMGAPGQTNILSNTMIIGGESTTAADAETAGHLEINGGVVQCAFITIGRGNGSMVTAPTGLVSTVRVNGGVVQSANGLYLAARMTDMATVTARPLFEMNDGVFAGPQLLCGNSDSPIRPRLVFNGGFAAFTGGGADDIHLAFAGGCTSETVVAGGTLAISNTVVKLSNHAAARGVLRLNGGRLITRGIQRLNSGVAELYLNGGVLQNCQNMTLTNLSLAAVQAGGLVADVPAGLTLTAMQALAHDAALGGTPDGGLVKLGTGTLTLGLNQGYTGPTVVSGGVLRVSGTLASTSMAVSGGAMLSLANGLNQTFAPSAFAAGDVNGNARVEMELAADGSAYDVLALPSGFGGTLALRLVKTGTAALFVRPGRYPLLTFSGAAPSTAGWTVEGLGAAATFETEGSAIFIRIGNGTATPSVWANPAGGAWGTAGNWTAAPADDASAGVLFGSAIAAPATVTTGGGVTFGYLAVDNANAYTWSGGALTLGSAVSNAQVHVVQGTHAIDADLAAPSAAAVIIDPGATLLVNGAVTGAGSLSVSGGGTLALTNGPAVDVPVAVDGATLAMPQTTAFDTPFTLGAAGAVFAPASGRTVTVTSGISGAGGLTKSGSSFLALEGASTFAGELLVRNGTVTLAAEPSGALVIGEGTLKYAGPGAAFTRGYTLRTTTSTQAATLDTDTDLTFNGQVKADLGAFIKWGSGTLTYAYPGENTLSAGDNITYGSVNLVRPYGDTPSQGYRSYNIFNGKVVLGVAGQTNRFSQAIVIGGQSTTNADAETAGHMEINGGVNLFADYVSVGRGNGSAVTAPAGLESTLTVNGGESSAKGFWMAAMMTNMTTFTARPLFTLNSGSFAVANLYCGNLGGTPKPKIVINGGTLTVGPSDTLRLGYGPGCETEMTVNGGLVMVTNQILRLTEGVTGARVTLNLNGGRVVAQNLQLGSTSSSAAVHFNGGVFQPSATATLSAIALTNRAGGALFDVPQGVTYTVQAALDHDAGLGGSSDGGVVKFGAGTLVLAGTNSYNGPTVVSNGTLNLAGTLPAAAELVAAPEGRLSLAAPAAAQLAVGSLTLGSASGAEAGLTLTADRASFLSGGALSVSGNLFLGKTAVTLVMRETGMAPSTNGTYVVLTCAGTISGSAAELRLANGLLGKAYAFSVAGSELLLTVATAGAESGAVVWKQAAGGEWSEAANWVTPPGAGAAGMTIGFLDAIEAPATVTLDDAATAGSLLFNNANAYTLAGAGSLALDGTNGVPLLVAEQGVHTVAVPVGLTENTTAALTNGTELWLTGALTGSGKLTKEGLGRLLLSGTNTYAGGTEVLAGTVDVAASGALGTGSVVFNGGSLAGKGSAPVTVANDAAVLKDTFIGAYAPLTLAGDWTATGGILFTKVASNELTVAGALKPAAGSTARLEHREGSVRFAAGADALFTSTSVRECIDFRSPASVSVNRSLSVEPGATVSTRCLYVGYGASNTVAVTGGSLTLSGFVGSPYSDALLMGAAGSASPRVWDRFEVSGGSVYAADGFWCLMGVDKAVTTLDVSGGTVSLGQVSMGHRAQTDQNSLSPSSDVVVRGGVLEARQRWNWIGDRYGARLNTVHLEGGRLRLPATFASVSNRLNQTRLVFNGGVLETTGGGLDAEDPTNYLGGLKQAFVGAGGAVVDTQGRSVTLAQRLTALGGVTDGGVVKRGVGTLALARPPCVTGRIDVQVGALRLAPEAGTAYPDDPAVRFSFDGSITNDDSAYAKHAGLTKGNTNNLVLVAGQSGTNALAFNGQNGLFVNYSDDMQGMDTYTVSTWVRQSAYQTVNNQAKTFFGTIENYSTVAHEMVLRIEGGAFRMLATGQENKPYGQIIIDVTNALPLNAWTMLTLVVNGTNGISMYVNGEKRTMRVTENSGGAWNFYSDFGIGKRWYFQPTSRIGGKAFVVGTTGGSDTTAFFIGDLDDLTVYRRALAEPELAMLYTAKVMSGRRARVAAGAALDLAGAAQAFSEVTGEGSVGNGTLTVSGLLNPGDAANSAAGALLTATGSLTLGTNVTYVCDWTPEENDLVDVWGTLRVEGAGTVDLGLTLPSQMPGSPRLRSFPVMYYTAIENAAAFAQWGVTGIGRAATATVTASGGVVRVNLEVPSGTLILMR